MNVISQTVSGQFRRKWLVSFHFFLFVLGVAYVVAGYITSGDLTGLAYVGLAFAAGAIVVAIFRNWRSGLYFFLAWLLFEDLARKFLGNNMALYFAKDFFAAAVYLSFFISWRRQSKNEERFRPQFRVALLLFIWFGIMQVFNPSSAHLAYGILGAKLYFYYMPLLMIGYYLVHSEGELRRFFHVNLGLMLVIVALGLVQSIAGPRFLNPAVMADDIRLLSETYRTAPISGAIVYRPTSVFVSAGRFQDLVIVAWMLVFGFSGYLLLRRRRGRNFAFLVLGITAAAAVMGASRGVFMWTLGSSLVGAAAFIWGAPWRHGQALRIFRMLQRAVVGVTLAAVVLLFTYPKAFLDRLAVFSETLDPRSPANELVHRTRDYPLRNFLAAFDYDRWPYGYGIGTLSLGGQYVARFFNAKPSIAGVESGFGCLIIELGIVGFILWLCMSGAILWSAWRVVRQLRGSPWFPLAFMIFWYAFLLLLPLTFQGMQAYQDFILNAYLWLLLGVLFRLPKLALDAQFAAPVAAHQQGSGRI